MATVDDALNLARAQLGNPPDQYWAWYPAPTGTAWCCIFQSWVLTNVGLPTHYAWVSGLFDAMRADGRCSTDRSFAQPGDLVAFDYDGTGASSYDHIAMVESVAPEGIYAINGNWTGKVCRVLHRWDASGFSGGIAEFARPHYSTVPTPPAPPSRFLPKDDDDMIDRYLMRANNDLAVYLVSPGLGWRWHVPAGQMASIVYVLGLNKGKILNPPTGAKVDVVEGQRVWVCSPDFLNAIPAA